MNDWYEYTAEEMNEPLHEQLAHVLQPPQENEDEPS